MLKLLLSILKENGSDNLSSNRVAFLISVILSNIIIFGTWCILSFINNELMSISESIIVIYGLSMGLSFGGKILQKNMETK